MGMEQLIFFGVIILFTILESAARKKRAQAAAEEEAGVGEHPPLQAEWEEQALDAGFPTHDAEPSYDDDAIAGEPLPQYTGRYESHDEPDEFVAPSQEASREVAPSRGLFAELAGLAARLEEASREASQQSSRIPVAEVAPSPAEPSRAVVPQRESSFGPAEVRPEHMVHSAHADYGTDPSERAPSEQDGLDPLAEHLGVDALAVRKQLMSHSLHALRQAVVMQEVLGPPTALRGDRFEH